MTLKTLKQRTQTISGKEESSRVDRGSADVRDDDINDMAFTAPRSAQIAEW